MNWSPEKLLETSSAYWQGSALQAAVRLEIFTHLSDASLPASALARQLGCDERALAMLLRALTAMELLVEDNVGYRCTEPLRYWLDANSNQYLGHIIRHHHHLIDSWARLDQAVRSGQPQRQEVATSDAEWREDFLLGMHNLSSLIAPKLTPQLPLADARLLLDVGGGPGTWSIHACSQNPRLRARVFDLPESREICENNVHRAGMSERIDFIAGDFLLDDLGQGYDVVWLSQVLHGEGPENAQRLVKKAAAALNPGGRLLIHEFILDNQGAGPVFAALFALNMLLGTETGQSYSEADLVGMCQQAGLHEVSRLPLPAQAKSGIICAEKR